MSGISRLSNPKLDDLGFDAWGNRPVVVNDMNEEVVETAQVIPPSSINYDHVDFNILKGEQAFKSENYVPGVSGWEIKGDGNVEFGSGNFRGSVNIPNGTNPLFSVDALGNMSAVSGKYLETFTAGENIADGDIVCQTYTYIDIYPSDDTYVSELNPTTNYSTEDSIKFGVDQDSNYGGNQPKQWIGFLKFDSSEIPDNDQIMSAELRLTSYSTVFLYPPEGNVFYLDISTISSGDWSESITYNTKPGGPFTGITTYANFTFGSGEQNKTVTQDVTDLIKQWKSGDKANYGFQFYTGSVSIPNSNFFTTSIPYYAMSGRIYSKEASNINYRPRLRIHSLDQTDNKVYKASNTNYSTRRSVIGVAQGSVSSGSKCKVQTHGTIKNINFGSVSGGRFYLLNTAGGQTSYQGGLVYPLVLGKIVNPTEAILNIQHNDIFIETQGSFTVTSGATKRIYINNDTRYILIYYSLGSDSALYTHTSKSFRGQNFTEGYNYSDGTHNYFTVSWGNYYVDISPSGHSITFSVYCFT